MGGYSNDGFGNRKGNPAANWDAEAAAFLPPAPPDDPPVLALIAAAN